MIANNVSIDQFKKVVDRVAEKTNTNLGELETDDKSNLVSAINEIYDLISVFKEGSGAGLHNSLYRGKYLGDSVTEEQYARIKDGSFTGLWIGDYWTINGITWRIAHFDYVLHTGYADKNSIGECIDHHIVIVPDQILYTEKMNDDGTTDGGFFNSDMHKSYLNRAKDIIKNSFGQNHILMHSDLLSSEVTDGKITRAMWCDIDVSLLHEKMIYGHGVSMLASIHPEIVVSTYKAVGNTQLKMFNYRPELIIAKSADNTLRADYWLRDIYTSKSYTVLSTGGDEADAIASHAGKGVRPYFLLY